MKKLRVGSPTSIALLSLGLGTGLGLLVFKSGSAEWLRVAENISALGTLWTNALRMTVIPLIVSTLVVAVAGYGISQGIGRIAGLSFATFAALLTGGVLVVLLVVPPVLSRLHLDARRPAASPGADKITTEEPSSRASSFKDVIATLLPTNLVKAAADDDLLPLVIFSIFLGLAATRIDAETRTSFIALFRGLAASMRVIIGWIIWFMPIGIFAFSFLAAASLGWNSLGILGAWIVISALLSFLLMAGLYLLAVLIGRVGLAPFAKALLPAQEVGFATRSSLAALPALLEGAQAHLKRNDAVSNVVLPLAVSSFKLNRTINSVARLLFLAYVYNVPLGAATFASFAVASMLMSFASPGLPARGPSATLPLYLAAGVPLEGIVLLRSVDSITDFAMTILNVTADMTAMTIVGRFSRTPAMALGADQIPATET